MSTFFATESAMHSAGVHAAIGRIACTAAEARPAGAV